MTLLCSSQKSRLRAKSSLAGLLLLVSLTTVAAQSGSPKPDRAKGKEMLETIKKDIEKYYYDNKFHGVDLDARFKIAEERIKKAASDSEIFGIVAQAVIDMNDSHTYFMPPSYMSRFDYGWRMQMVGDTPFVVAVKPGSEAEVKGLNVGDVVYSIDGYAPTRQNLWKIEYSYYAVKPKTAVRLVLENPDGSLRDLEINTKIEPQKSILGPPPASPAIGIQYYEQSQKLIVCKIPSFMIPEKDIDEMMKKIRDHEGVVFDLRRNSGGYEKTLTRLISHLFDHDVKIGELVQRHGHKELIAKTVGEKAFKGQVAVVVDSKTASASELIARVLQLEKRATIIGDRTRGAVMRGRRYVHDYKTISVVRLAYAVSVTEADIIMTDGQSLEGKGVTPDELLVPKAIDLKTAKDPVLSRAAAILGVKIDPKKAGNLYITDRTTEVVFEDDVNEEPPP